MEHSNEHSNIIDDNSNITWTSGSAMVRRQRTFHCYVIEHIRHSNRNSPKFLAHADNREESRESGGHWRRLVAPFLDRSYYHDDCIRPSCNT